MEQKKNTHLLRRTLVPFLMVALPIAAMIAFILYHKHAAKSNLESETATSAPAPASFGHDSWEIFRGNAELTGQAAGALPDKLSLSWKFETGDAVRSTPIIARNKVFVSSMDKHLYALNLNSGTEIWKFAADDELEASPLYHHGFIYVGSNSGTFYCIDAETGGANWSFKVNGKITGSANVAIGPETERAVILFGCYDNNIYCLDAETGKLIFKYPAKSYINGAIGITNRSAVFGSCDANIYLVPITDPNTATTIDAESYVASNPAISEDIIYAGSYEGMFLAANAKTQKILWRFDETKDAYFSAPAVNDAVIIIGCRDRNVYCLDRLTGKKRWTFSARGNFDSSPVICGDKVAIGCDDGRLYLLDIDTGTEVFSYTLGSPVVSSPAIAQNRLVIGCDNGNVYAFIASH